MQIPRRQFMGQCLAVALLGGLCATRAEARNKRKKKNKKRPLSKKGHASELPKVQSVSPAKFEIRVGGKFYEVRENAEIIVNGGEATLKDVKVGMQAMVTGGVKKAGRDSTDTIYKATRIVARTDNDLEKKAKESNKKANANNKK